MKYLSIIRLIAIMETIAGSIGIIYIIAGIFDKLPLYMLMLGFLLFVLSFTAGIKTWDESRNGIYLSLLVQILQIPYFIICGFVYAFNAGPYVNFIFGSNDKSSYFTRIDYGINTIFSTGWIGPPGSLRLGINFFSILIVFFLLVKLRTMKSDENSMELSEQYKDIVND